MNPTESRIITVLVATSYLLTILEKLNTFIGPDGTCNAAGVLHNLIEATYDEIVFVLQSICSAMYGNKNFHCNKARNSVQTEFNSELSWLYAGQEILGKLTRLLSALCGFSIRPVSYTHLTLPTIYSV